MRHQLVVPNFGLRDGESPFSMLHSALKKMHPVGLCNQGLRIADLDASVTYVDIQTKLVCRSPPQM